ncbi:branched-chain amino acid ABC transporter permease [Acidithrix sp. C25]|uniref:branched-chain amino acid ABC transporter permease n=1 Tax=Acidithrix sp. C25 TaxID=1671482 RepID=UPI00191BAFE7|nr:branched-chain amino acid ABC transporter permease [Acidithrix sp. C25]
MLFEYAVIGGILLGIFYALLAVGLNVVYGAQKIINLAHGDIIMLGGYGAWELYNTYHISPILSTIIVIPITVLFGYLLNRLIAPRLVKASDPEMLSLILFFGLSEVIQALASLVFGSAERSLPVSSIPTSRLVLFGQGYPATWWVSALVIIPLLAIFVIFLYRTSIGLQVRAVISDSVEAAVAGINSKRVSGIYFGIGFALAACAGVWGVFIFGGVSPTEGTAITITAFAIIVFGSLGNTLGTIAAGIIFGIFYQLAQVYIPSWSNLVPYALVIATMLIRPQGLFGRRQRIA